MYLVTQVTLMWSTAVTHKQFCLGCKHVPQYDGFKVGTPHPTTKFIGYPKSVALTYPLRIGILHFQVDEQLLRIPIKQRRKVYNSGDWMLSGIESGWAEMMKV